VWMMLISATVAPHKRRDFCPVVRWKCTSWPPSPTQRENVAQSVQYIGTCIELQNWPSSCEQVDLLRTHLQKPSEKAG